MVSSLLKFRLVVREDEKSEAPPIMESAIVEAPSMLQAWAHFAEKLDGMTPDRNLPVDAPCGGYFSALSNDFAGKFWEIEGVISP